MSKINSIEEAVEILRNAIKCNEKQFEELGTHILLQDDEQEAIKIVLGNLEALCDMQRSSDREIQRQKQINEEHQKINGELRKKVKELEEENKLILNSKVGVDLSYEDYIPKQKIKDKIEELIIQGNYKTFYNPNGRTHFLKEESDYKIEVLEKLLKESEETNHAK